MRRMTIDSSCVTSSRAFVKSEPKVVEDFLNAYVAAIQLIKKDQGFAERSLANWRREKDSTGVGQSIESHRRILKIPPYVPDKGIENVVNDLASRRKGPKEFIGKPELFRDNGAERPYLLVCHGKAIEPWCGQPASLPHEQTTSERKNLL